MRIPRLLDVTSKGDDPWVKFSPRGGIPVPISGERTAQSVEGIWQSLKVFEKANVDEPTLDNATMRNIKRTVRKHGSVLGHRKGIHGDDLLAYVDARRQIYLPAYRWVLESAMKSTVEELRELGQSKTVVLLDYGTNEDIEDTRKPLSHAGLVKRWLEGDWPTA